MTDNNMKKSFKVPTWDLPLRLFHWSLVITVSSAWITGSIGGDWIMTLHLWLGTAVTALLLFRLGWGIWGGFHARFSSFVSSPQQAWRYARALLLLQKPASTGHNPLGAWMVLAMLLTLAAQVGTGLFAGHHSHDDINGPLYHWVTPDTAELVKEIHEYLSDLVLVLVITHVTAVIGYLWLFKDNLIKPMVVGYKKTTEKETRKKRSPLVNLVLFLLTAALSGAAVYWLIITGDFPAFQ